MNPIKPTIGRVVIYTVVPGDKSFDGNGSLSRGEGQPIELPADIVRVWGDTCVNLKVKNDGPTDVWITSVNYDPEGRPGTWRWVDYQLNQAKTTGAEKRTEPEAWACCAPMSSRSLPLFDGGDKVKISGVSGEWTVISHTNIPYRDESGIYELHGYVVRSELGAVFAVDALLLKKVTA